MNKLAMIVAALRSRVREEGHVARRAHRDRDEARVDAVADPGVLPAPADDESQAARHGRRASRDRSRRPVQRGLAAARRARRSRAAVLRRARDREAQARQAPRRPRRARVRFRSSSSGPIREQAPYPLADARRSRHESRSRRWARARRDRRRRHRPALPALVELAEDRGRPVSHYLAAIPLATELRLAGRAPLTFKVCAGTCQRWGALDVLDHLAERGSIAADEVRARSRSAASIAATSRPPVEVHGPHGQLVHRAGDERRARRSDRPAVKKSPFQTISPSIEIGTSSPCNDIYQVSGPSTAFRLSTRRRSTVPSGCPSTPTSFVNGSKRATDAAFAANVRSPATVDNRSPKTFCAHAPTKARAPARFARASLLSPLMTRCAQALSSASRPCVAYDRVRPHGRGDLIPNSVRCSVAVTVRFRKRSIRSCFALRIHLSLAPKRRPDADPCVERVPLLRIDRRASARRLTSVRSTRAVVIAATAPSSRLTSSRSSLGTGCRTSSGRASLARARRYRPRSRPIWTTTRSRAGPPQQALRLSHVSQQVAHWRRLIQRASLRSSCCA